jgi:hypothetical protein
MAKKVVKKISNERHWGITVLSVLSYIGAVITVLLGLTMLFGSSTFSSLIGKAFPQLAAYVDVGTVLFVVLGIIFIGMAVLDYFIARGLWNGQNWARIVAIILSALTILGALWPFDIVSLIIGIVIIWYLGFYKPAVNYFK